ncbi:MAG: hypothetical protein U0325_17205 [Polyangiales bacterium]
MRRGVALACVTALLAASAWCARDARQRLQTRAAREPLHRRSAALVGPGLCLRRGEPGPPGEAPGVADTRPHAFGARAP